MSDLWPTELRVSKDRQRLVVTFNDGAAFDLSAELLRVLSPSAEVQGHGPGQKVTVPGKRNAPTCQRSVATDVSPENTL